jgi:gas vesicle protein
MKTQNIHIGSLLIGLLAGGVILLVLALSQPLRAETRTSQLLRNDSRQFQVTTSRSFGKTWAQFRSGFALDWQKTVRSISQTINKNVGRIGSSLHGSAFQPCFWVSWLDQQIAHLAAPLNLHTGLLNPPACKV